METQESVSTLMSELFPQFATAKDHVSSIAEEMFELAFAEGFNMNELSVMMKAVFDKTMRQRLEGKGGEPPEAEAGDLHICLLTYATKKGFKLQDATDAKMAEVRSHPPEYYRAKHDAKLASGHVLPSGGSLVESSST